MNWRRLLVLMAVGAATVAHAEETPQQLIVPPGQVIVQVKGVVCSFCAYGTEKNLAKLTFLDHSQFGDGVLMDIYANRITLALAPDAPLDLRGIYQAIKKGGYDPQMIYLRLSGTVTRQADRYVLRTAKVRQPVELIGQGLEQVPDQQVVDVQAHLDATQLSSVQEGQPVTMVVDTVEHPS